MTSFVIADLHFGDKRAFAGRRNRFRSLTDMETTIIDRWNATVDDRDTIYLLGDVSTGGSLDLVRQLRGIKHLVAGNADDLVLAAQSGLFKSVGVIRWLRGAVLSHVPVHPTQLRGSSVNVHGHLHAATVGDPRYRCVSVEQTSFAPVRLDSLVPRNAKRAQELLF